MGNHTESTSLPKHFRHLQDLTIQQTCQVLQISQPTVWRLVRKGILSKYNIGRSARIHSESVSKLRGGSDV